MRSSIPVGAPWPGFSPLNFILHSSITISTPLAHLELHIRHSSFPGGAPRFPPNSSYLPFKPHYDSPLANLNSNPFSYHKSSQTTLEFNFTHSPSQNHSEIQGAPPDSMHRGWIVCSCVCRPWWDGRFAGWHLDYVRLHSDRLIGLMFRFYLLSFLNHLSFSLVLLNVAMQTIECWMRCWVL